MLPRRGFYAGYRHTTGTHDNADLILSKLIWARDANSDLQKRDVRTLLDDSVDWLYLREWAAKLGIKDMLEDVSK